MSLIDLNALEKFSSWAEANRHNFPEISGEEVSYFIDRKSEESYIMPYSFETLEELRCGLEKYSGLSANSQILKMLTTEICRNRFGTDSNANLSSNVCNVTTVEGDARESIPDYVYVF